MTGAFRTPEDYEHFLYTLAERYPPIQQSTLVLMRRGATLARVHGEVRFAQDIRLVVLERLVFDRLPLVIEAYGYEIWRGNEKLYWYDSQPHPNEPALQGTHPHHKHVPPDIKHNRIPAETMSFERPNLPHLIEEIMGLIQRIKGGRGE